MFDIDDTPEKVIQGILRISIPRGKKRGGGSVGRKKPGRDIALPLRVDPKQYNDEIPDPENDMSDPEFGGHQEP
ncbi:MAG TPA: hypothetical protein GXX23_03090 [Firmicutes bacterium]|nr:hypothetical protein [Candidatus Fermentithermobacillaceae bacterium]